MPSFGDDVVEVFRTVTSLDERLRADTSRCHRAVVELVSASQTKVGGTIDREESAFWMRTFLRVFFAQVEGLCYAMRRASVYMARQGHLKLSEGELCVLEEKRYRSQKGIVKEVMSFNETLENMHLAFRYFPRVFGAKYELAKSDSRWDYFADCLRIRNRLSHPKKPEDLDLTVDEMKRFADGFKWFTE